MAILIGISVYKLYKKYIKTMQWAGQLLLYNKMISSKIVFFRKFWILKNIRAWLCHLKCHFSKKWFVHAMVSQTGRHLFESGAWRWFMQDLTPAVRKLNVIGCQIRGVMRGGAGFPMPINSNICNEILVLFSTSKRAIRL